MFEVDQLAIVRPQLERRVVEERNRYDYIYAIIDSYIASADDIVLGGVMGLHLMLGRERSWDDYVYHLYSESALSHANTLTNTIARTLVVQKKTDIIAMRTKIAHVSYEIVVDGRVMVMFHNLKSNPVRAIDLIRPIAAKWFVGDTGPLAATGVSVLSPETYLLDIYWELTSPALADEWQANLDMETALVKMLGTRRSALKRVDGGDGGDDISLKLLKEFVANNDHVLLLGEHALRFYDAEVVLSSSVIHVISDLSADEIIGAIRVIVAPLPATKNDRTLNMMQDARLRRLTIRVGDEHDSREVMYVYNSAEYDLVPFNTLKSEEHSIRVGNPYVLLRFMLVDLWMIKWVLSMGKINEQFANKRMDNILTNFFALRDKLNGICVFQTHDYIGTYHDEIIDQKMSSIGSQKFKDYYPQEYIRKNGNYRDLS